MRPLFLSAVLGAVVLLLGGCSLAETISLGRADLLPSSTAPAISQAAGTDPTSMQDIPVDNPASQEETALPDTTNTEGNESPVSAGTTEASAAPTSAAATEAPSPTPVPVLRQLTSGGCCVQPSWSPDGGQVWYLDRPSAEAASGLWGIPVQGGEAQLITDRQGIYSSDMQLRAFPVNGTTVVERVSTGEQWTIPNDGRAVSFSPDGSWLAWTAGQSDPPFDTARRQVWVSRFDGTQAYEAFSTIGGGFSGWFPDGRLLVSGRVEGSDTEQAYWALSLDPSQAGQQGLLELARGERLREAQVSKDGNWLAYMVTFSQVPSRDGLWLVDTHSGERRQLDVFGSYQWRDGERLLVVPLDLSQPAHWLLQVHASTGEVQALTDPALMPFKIANGDWSVSPDGRSIVFNSARDGNLWVLELPDQG